MIDRQSMGIIYHGSRGQASPIGRVTELLEQTYLKAEETGWGEVIQARWDALCEAMYWMTFYKPDEIKTQIAARLRDLAAAESSPPKRVRTKPRLRSRS